MPDALESPPVFHEAVARLRSYLKANGRPETIAWVDPNDLLKAKNGLRVRLRSPQHMWTKAQVRYELGLDRKLGILLEQVCQIPGLSCCHVYIPKSAQDADQRLNGSLLEVAITEQVRRAKAVTSALHWTFLKMRKRG